MTKHLSLEKSIKHGETLGQHYKRIMNGGARKPLRTLDELAEEFSLSKRSLQGKLAKAKDSPKPRYSTGNSRSSQYKTWYDPDEMRAWWKSKT